MRLLISGLCILALVVPGHAAKKIRLSTGSTQKIPAVGLKIRVFREQEQVPIPDAKVYVYENRRTGQKFEAFEPVSLWVKEQLCAVFRGKEGDIHLALPTRLMPTRMRLINGRHVRAQDYEAVVAEEKTEWTKEELNTWVQTFAGKIKTEAPLKHRLAFPCTEYSFANSQMEGYLVTPLNKQPIFLAFTFPAGVDDRTRGRGVERVLKSIGFYTPEEKSNPSKRFQNRRTKNREASEAFEKTRKRVIDSVKNLKDWWYAETTNYILKSNLDSRNRKLVLAIQENVEIMRAAYQSCIPELKEIEEVSVVTVFATRNEYRQYVPAEYGWTGGIWMPSRRELVISPVMKNRKQMSKEGVLQVVYHEAFHQYIYYALNRIELPIWFNEGHACLFEASEVSQRHKQATVQVSQKRYSSLERALKAGYNLRTLLTMTREDFYNAKSRQANYAVAWGLCYFLRKAAWLYPNNNYEKICDLTLKKTISTKDWRKASEAVISSVDIAQLNKDFRDFWSSKSKQRKAARYRVFDDKK